MALPSPADLDKNPAVLDTPAAAPVSHRDPSRPATTTVQSPAQMEATEEKPVAHSRRDPSRPPSASNQPPPARKREPEMQGLSFPNGTNDPNDQTDDHFYQQGTAPIKTMQQALINLAKEIQNHNLFHAPDQSAQNGDQLTGSDPFMSFLVKNYANKAKTTGKSLVNVDIKQPTRMDTSKENDNFKNILNSITHIGSGNQDSTPDGLWGQRTTNALKQVYSLAHAMVEVKKDMGLQIQGYTDADLSELYANIPQDDKISLNEQVKRAPILTKAIDKLRGLYDNFRETILNSYHDQIGQASALSTNETKRHSNVSDVLSQDDLLDYDQNKAEQLDATINGKKTAITPYDLSTFITFQNFLMKNPALGFSEEQRKALGGNNPDTTLFRTYLGQALDSIKANHAPEAGLSETR